MPSHLPGPTAPIPVSGIHTVAGRRWSVTAQGGALKPISIGRPQPPPWNRYRELRKPFCNIAGGVITPLLANIALGVLDEHFTARWQVLGPTWRRKAIRKQGGATVRLVRYADNFVILVPGTREHADAVQTEAAAALAPMGLRLSAAKTRVCHIDEGFDFLGFHIQRRRKRGTSRQAIYTYPSAKALLAIKRRVRSLTRRELHRTLADLLRRLNPAFRGWCTYFQHGVSKRTFGYVGDFAFWRVIGWLRKHHVPGCPGRRFTALLAWMAADGAG